MSLFALSVEAERLFLLMLLGRSRLQHGLLPPAASLPYRHYVALHAADTPADGALLERLAWDEGWEAKPGLGDQSRPTFLLRPLDPWLRRDGKNVRFVDLTVLPRGAIVAIAPIIGEDRPPPCANRSPSWFLGDLVHLPAPVFVCTDDYALFRPWEVFRPALSQVRRGWRAAQQVVFNPHFGRRSA